MREPPAVSSASCSGAVRATFAPVQWTAEHAALDSAAGVYSLFRELQEAEATEQAEALLARDPAGQVDLDSLSAIALLLALCGRRGRKSRSVPWLTVQPPRLLSTGPALSAAWLTNCGRWGSGTGSPPCWLVPLRCPRRLG
jgi:hypothetical protein